ncbi:hypothetical protein TWF225_007187 [Orbilia oligospora]|nr:hypothetical protein TWF225_007187 [Orbilia oligospora]KAF3271976.1 hypothetical protein TWF217_003798 [Orbilia oligospora]
MGWLIKSNILIGIPPQPGGTQRSGGSKSQAKAFSVPSTPGLVRRNRDHGSTFNGKESESSGFLESLQVSKAVADWLDDPLTEAYVERWRRDVHQLDLEDFCLPLDCDYACLRSTLTCYQLLYGSL